MIPEKQCCTVEQSKKLRELGLSAKSEFHWVLNSAREDWKVTRKGSADDFSFLPHLEAYTASELASILSRVLDGSEYEAKIDLSLEGVVNIYKLSSEMPALLEERDMELKAGFAEDGITQAFAQCLIWMADNNFIELKGLDL